MSANHCIDVLGATKSQKALIEDAARYYLQTLLRGRKDHLLITIRLRKGLLSKSDYGVKADCLFVDEEDGLKEFDIRIDADMRLQGILRCLAHEMVHVAQYTTGSLKEGRVAGESIWHGKKWVLRHYSYYDHPWEVEALGKEEGLFEKFISARSLQKRRWYFDADYVR